MLKNTRDRYAGSVILLHWLMLFLIVAVYVFMALHHDAPKGTDLRATYKYWHMALGLGVLLLVLIRLGLRLQAGPAPVINPAPARWILASSHVMHLALYGFMIIMPLLGWLYLSLRGASIPFGLPPLVGESKDIAHYFKETHEAIGELGFFLIALHAAAALLHHYFLKDNTLKRMTFKR